MIIDNNHGLLYNGDDFGAHQALGDIASVGLSARASAMANATGLFDKINLNYFDFLANAIDGNNIIVNPDRIDFASKLIALWVHPGTTAAENKFNFMDPRDLNAAYRLVFSGGVTHGAGGFKGNATDGTANTFLPANVAFPTLDGTYGVYIRDNIAQESSDIGASQNLSGQPGFNAISTKWSDNKTYANLHMRRTSGAEVDMYELAGNPFIGLISCIRYANVVHACVNGTMSAGSTSTNTTPITSNLHLMSRGGSGFYSSREQSLAYVMTERLTSTELTIWYNIVQKSQVIKGRDVY